MIPQFARHDLKAVLHYQGKLITGLGFAMLLPLGIALINFEFAPAVDFIIAILICVLAGRLLVNRFPHAVDLNWRQGMSIVALSWLVATLLGAIPLFLSGHYLSFLDASFETMSAFTTTGLVLVNNLDHMAYSYNFWRHFMCFIGGQGIILVAMTILVKGGSALKVYIGEAREEKIMPNVVQTARFIWFVSITYLIIWTAVLFTINVSNNMAPGRALFHAVCLFMSGWDTAGFAVQSQSILYYHSPAIEVITAIIFMLGAINFGVHYAVWTGRPRELMKNFELKVHISSIMLLFALVCIGFVFNFPFSEFLSFFRKTFYQLLSAHTGVGYSNILSSDFNIFWSQLSIIAIIIAMGLGASSSSTAGGIKMLRVGIFLKGIKKEIRTLTSPESAVIVEKFHHMKPVSLQDVHIKTALMIILLYISLYLLGAILGTVYGYPFMDSLFESVSASANVGLSSGITSPSMPNGLKAIYMSQMWLGRLEFISIFVLIRFIISLRSPQ